MVRRAAAGTPAARTANVQRGKVSVATVAIAVAGDRWTVPLAIAANCFHAQPLPVLSWERSGKLFDRQMYSNAYAYAAGRTHRLQDCGHVVQRVYADLGEPFRAFGWLGARCFDCQSA